MKTHHPKAAYCCLTAASLMTMMSLRLSDAWLSSSAVMNFRPKSVTTTTTTKRWMASSSSSTENDAASSSGNTKEGDEFSRPRVLAEGVVVAQFPGGMTAVRIQDETKGDEQQQRQPAADLAATSSASTQPILQAGLAAATTTTTTATISEDDHHHMHVQKKDPSRSSPGDYQGMQVVFPNGRIGVVVAHRPPLIFCYSSSKSSHDNNVGMDNDDGTAQLLAEPMTISVVNNKKATDCFGNFLRFGDLDNDSSEESDLSSSTKTVARPIFAPIPKVSDIALINSPLLTGITMMDTLAPIGQGQNMLWIGHDITQMRNMAQDVLQTQKDIRKCVYASTDPDGQAAIQRLGDLADSVHFVGPSGTKTTQKDEDAASRAAEAVVIASSACALAEMYALEQGLDTLVVVDTIDSHKDFWDATTRVLVDVFSVDAVVQSDREGGASSEMRGFYSSLIQRAGQYNKRRGGGSVTLLLLTTIPKANADGSIIFEPSDFEQASVKMKERINLLIKRNIPLTAANLQKINIPIPSASEGQRRLVLQHVDDLISMSDGQVWLDERLGDAGQQPPMDPQRSITRIGIGADTQSRADAPALSRIAEGLRLDLSQAANMDGAEATTASAKQTRRQRALLLAMHQPAGSDRRSLADSCALLLAAKEGFLDKTIDNGGLAGSVEGEKVIYGLLEHLRDHASNAMDDINTSLDISDASRVELKESMACFFELS